MQQISHITEAGADQRQFLTFDIRGEEYAIGILRVKEVIQFDAITQVPGTPRSIRGVINLRGGVVPVIDLGVKFDHEVGKITKWSCVVIIETDMEGTTTDMGLLVDSVSNVVEFSASDIEPPPSFGSQVNVEYLLGMGKSGRKFVQILDVESLLTVRELESAVQVIEQADSNGAATDEENADKTN